MKSSIALRSLVAGAAVLGTAIAVTPAMADYPERVIELVVPASPGGGSDTAARTIATFLQQHLGEDASIAVLNRPGGGATIGIAAAAAADPDGYTIGQLQSPQLISKQFENPSVRFNADSFEYIGVVTTDSLAIAVLNSSEIRTHADLIAAAQDGSISCALSGAGGGPHLATMQYINAGGAALNLVNFDGGSEARAAVLGGHVDAICINIGGMARALGDLNVLAIASVSRNELIPDTPTMGELGFDVVGGTQRLLAVPAGTPSEIIDTLRDAYAAVMADPAFLEAAAQVSMQLDEISGEDIDAILHAQEAAYQEMWESTPWIQDR